jgi:hypothetical protein
VTRRKPPGSEKFLRKSQNSERAWLSPRTKKSPGFQNCFHKRRRPAVACEHEGREPVRHARDDAE